jgi:hypothetical protein
MYQSLLACLLARRLAGYLFDHEDEGNTFLFSS